jgi:hypothetical protein
MRHLFAFLTSQYVASWYSHPYKREIPHSSSPPMQRYILQLILASLHLAQLTRNLTLLTQHAELDSTRLYLAQLTISRLHPALITLTLYTSPRHTCSLALTSP